MTQIDRTHTRLPVKGRGFVAALLLGAAATVSLPMARTGLAAHPSSHSRVQATINIGVKNFDEEYIIADMYQLLLQKAGFGVKQHVLGQTSILHAALLKGQIDLYPEYTGTGLVAVLKRKAIANPVKAYDVVKNQYQKRFKLTWLEQ